MTLPETDARVRWDRFWSDPDARIAGQTFNPKLVECLQTCLEGVSGKLILEAGAGTALDSIELTRRGARVVALDYSPVALGYARNRAAALSACAYLVQGEVQHLPVPAGTFDAVFHAGVLEHFADPRPLLLEQRRVIRPRGVLLVDVPQTYNLYTLHKARQMRAATWYAGWETQYTIGSLEALLKRLGFEVVAAYGYGYYPPLLARVRWASSIGKGFARRSIMPPRMAQAYERGWRWIERTRAFLYCAQCIGVAGRKV